MDDEKQITNNIAGAVGVLVLVLFVVGIGALGYWYFATNQDNNSQITPTPPLTQTLKIPTLDTLTPTPDPTADWNTYVDEEYGYSIKYPKSWFDRGSGQGSGYVYQSYSYLKEQKNWLQDDSLVSVRVYRSLEDNLVAPRFWRDLAEYFNAVYQMEVGENKVLPSSLLIKSVNVEKISNYAIGARKATKVKVTPGPNAGPVFEAVKYYIWDEDRIFEINISIPFTNKHYQTAEEIAESFKFID